MASALPISQSKCTQLVWNLVYPCMGIFYGKLTHVKCFTKRKWEGLDWKVGENQNMLNEPEEWFKQVLFPRRFINKHGCLYFINNTCQKARSAFRFVISSFSFSSSSGLTKFGLKNKSLQGWRLAASLHLQQRAQGFPRTDPSYRKMMMQNPISLHHIPQRILCCNQGVSHIQNDGFGPLGHRPCPSLLYWNKCRFNALTTNESNVTFNTIIILWKKWRLWTDSNINLGDHFHLAFFMHFLQRCTQIIANGNSFQIFSLLSFSKCGFSCCRGQHCNAPCSKCTLLIDKYSTVSISAKKKKN